MMYFYGSLPYIIYFNAHRPAGIRTSGNGGKKSNEWTVRLQPCAARPLLDSDHPESLIRRLEPFRLTSPPRAATFTTEQVVAFHVLPVVDDTGARTGSWRCRIWQRSYRQQDGRGRSNLMAHVRDQHSDFEAAMHLAPVSETGSLVSWVSQRAQNRIRWISWIVKEKFPFSFL
jgi:hypothetical protein